MEKTDPTKSKGMASSKRCPRQGMVYLASNRNELLALPTNCKSWSCRSCRDRKLGFVASLMQYGLYRLTEPVLLSVTYVAHERNPGLLEKYVDAESAKKDWAALVRILKRDPHWKQMAFFRVVELTKKNQIHFHVLLGNVTSTLQTCRPPGKRSRQQWNQCVFPKCPCMECVISRAWFAVTRDSWVVDVRPIYDTEGASWYLCKYLKKGMYGAQRDELEARGFIQRYYRSNNWPSGVQMKRRGSLEKRWQRVTFEYSPPNNFMIHQSQDHPLMEQMGTDLAKKMALKQKGKRIAILHEKVVSPRHSARNR